MMKDILVIVALVAIVIDILVYLYKAKKRGEGCIGCPHAKQCASKGKCNHHTTNKTS